MTPGIGTTENRNSEHCVPARPPFEGHFGHLLLLGATLFAVWLLWSGHYTPLLIGFGVASCLLVVAVSRRMHTADREAQLLPLVPGLVVYLPWLFKEIAVANLDVARRVLHPSLPISPTRIRVRAGQATDTARVLYANSITLTPGTVSIDMEDGEIIVHALTREAAAGVGAGTMDRKVTRSFEGKR